MIETDKITTKRSIINQQLFSEALCWLRGTSVRKTLRFL